MNLDDDTGMKHDDDAGMKHDDELASLAGRGPDEGRGTFVNRRVLVPCGRLPVQVFVLRFLVGYLAKLFEHPLHQLVRWCGVNSLQKPKTCHAVGCLTKYLC